MTNRKRSGLLAIAIVSALAVAGCVENPEAGRPSPQALATTAASAAPDSEPTAAPDSIPTAAADSIPTGAPSPSPGALEAPERPAAATGLTLAAAEAFIGHYVDLINHSYTTGDAQPMLAASDKGCLGCDVIADFVKLANARNGGLTGDYQDRLVSVKEVFRGRFSRLAGSAELRTGAFRERPTRSAAPIARRPSSSTMEFTLSVAAGNWVMYEIQINQ